MVWVAIQYSIRPRCIFTIGIKEKSILEYVKFQQIKDLRQAKPEFFKEHRQTRVPL